MAAPNLSEKAQTYLHKLCVEIPSRRVGSAGNRAATDFFAQTIASFGWATETPGFTCIDWAEQGADLMADGEPFVAQVSPYSLGGQAQAVLVACSTLAELEQVEAEDRVLLLTGDLCKEQLMPKNFVFYNPEEHQRIIALLEEKQPAAIVAATGRNPEVAGAVYPFPLIEDGDFDIPSVFMTEEEGARLAGLAGREVSFDIRAQRSPAIGCNVVAHKGAQSGRRLVLFAHIDAKEGTPGAIDNATGVVILLLLAEMLADHRGELGVEIVALNGEDYYAASGEMLWLGQNAGRFQEIMLGVNMDGVGYADAGIAYSLYECPDELAGVIRRTLASLPAATEGEPWYQSDHSLFVFNGVPALAFTSDQFAALWTEIAHTPNDAPDIVDPQQLVNVAQALSDLIARLAERMSEETAAKSMSWQGETLPEGSRGTM
ncbi:MAG: M28 family peptidase [Caldilineales bacterium]|nr:M28 family peptidase [Caldilineales bacterium]